MSVNETHAEATAEKSSAVGNEAAMRKALESVAAWLLERFGNPADPDHDKAEVFYILATGVLAAPPRNCDRMGVDDAFSAFSFMCDNTNCSECPYKRHNRFGDRELCAMLFLYDNGNGGKEQEGGSDGSK